MPITPLRHYAALAIGAIGVTAFIAAVALNTQRASPIPAAAAAEANIACNSFSGLSAFSVERLHEGTTDKDGTPLARYRVTATCNSEHTVTGVIAVGVKS